MSKTMYLHVYWDESREKNNAKAGDSGEYEVIIEEGQEVNLIGLTDKALVKTLTDSEVTLEIPAKGEYRLYLGESTTITYSNGYQVCGDWVDEKTSYTIRFSDKTIADYLASLPTLEIVDGVLKVSRSKDKVIVIPEGVVEIGTRAFAYGNMEEVVFPSTLKKIGLEAFSHCQKLSKAVLPEGLEYIQSFAFAATAIEDINIPESVTMIDDYAFAVTPFLEKLSSQGDFVILGKKILYLYLGSDDEVEIPEGIEIICPSAFCVRGSEFYFDTPRKVILPASVKVISRYAFGRLSNLQEINLREDIKIDKRAFEFSAYNTQFLESLKKKGEN